MKLYEITHEIEKILIQVENLDGEITSELEQSLEALEMMEEEKVNSVIGAIKTYQMLAGESREESRRYADKARRFEKMAESCERYLLSTLGKDAKRETRYGKLSFRRSEAVEIVGEIPSAFIRVEVKESPDKTLIKNTLKEGGEVPGAVIKENYSLIVK